MTPPVSSVGHNTHVLFTVSGHTALCSLVDSYLVDKCVSTYWRMGTGWNRLVNYVAVEQLIYRRGADEVARL